ncbi:GerMN domain-containing protein [Desulfoscipio sp. XC116]|uniref:GerMN domain-containing protein n=1 Tax=Desulfoscipio sp. XC116 TaxID=3144975 RepID=UPI00325AD3D1
MKAVIKFFVYMGLIMLVMYSSGCAGNAANLYNNHASQDDTAKLTQPKDDDGSQTTVVGNKAEQSDNHNVTTNKAGPATMAAPNTTRAATDTIVLYFADADGYLQAERRSINKTAGIARQTMRELCLGPSNRALSATIPEGTRLLDINIQDGLCTVNFNQELVSNHSGGSGAENVTVYSIVNTLTQFSSVEQVQILVAGRVVESIAGHLDVSVPLTRDGELIKAGAKSQAN